MLCRLDSQIATIPSLLVFTLHQQAAGVVLEVGIESH